MPVLEGAANVANVVDGAKETASLISTGTVVAVSFTAATVTTALCYRQIRHAYQKEIATTHEKGVAELAEAILDKPEVREELNVKRIFGHCQPYVEDAVEFTNSTMPLIRLTLERPDTSLIYLMPFSGGPETRARSSRNDEVVKTLVAGVPDLACRVFFGDAPAFVRVPGLVLASSETVRTFVKELPIVGQVVEGISDRVARMEDGVVSIISHQYERGIVRSLKELQKTEFGQEWIGPDANTIVKYVVANFIGAKTRRFAKDAAARTFRGAITILARNLIIKGLPASKTPSQPVQLGLKIIGDVAAGGAYQEPREIALRAGASLIEWKTGSWMGACALLYGGQAIFFVYDKVQEHNQPETEKSKVEIIDEEEALIAEALADFEAAERGETPDVDGREFYPGLML